MSEKDTQDIVQRLTKIETLLEGMQDNNDLKLQNFDEKIKVANHRIDDLEATNKWLWRSIAATLIGAVMALILK